MPTFSDATSGTITLSGSGISEHVYEDSGVGTITLSAGTSLSLTGSITTVRFSDEFHFERGDHASSPPQRQTVGVAPYATTTEPHDAVQAATDVLGATFLVVAGSKLIASRVNGSYRAGITPRH